MQTDSVQRKRKWVESTEYQTDGKKRAHLRIVTDISAANDSDLKSICAESSGSLSAVDSLFDEPTQSAKPASRTAEERWSDFSLQTVSLASRTAPPIPGLFAPKVRLP